MRKPKQQPRIPPEIQEFPVNRTGVIAAEDCVANKAAELATRLGLPLVTEERGWGVLLRVRSKRLELYSPTSKDLQQGIWVDFSTGRSKHRRLQSGSELLVRAVKIKGKASPLVIDATGGLGRDAFLLASHGFQVHVIEKNRIIAALLEDGLDRGVQTAETATICRRITLSIGDAATLLDQLSTQPDVVYLDPMFPPRTKSAKVKKDLQLIQRIHGVEGNLAELLDAARSASPSKIVVKRPLRGGYGTAMQPDYSFKGRAVRFDVYLRR